MTPTTSEVAIIGAGFGGLGAAIRLTRAGYDVAVLEAGDDVGGTWRDNTYPGCACDVPSHLYSFSFAPNPEWSETFSGQAEILDYLKRCVVQFGLRSRVHLGRGVVRADWDETAARWRLTTVRGEHVARSLIVATGPLSDPSTPDLPGLASFAGTTFHSARWDHRQNLAGRRVAVIGTGASAVQFVPRIQPAVARLSLFQRTPPWILPRRTRPIGRRERAAYRWLPGAQWLNRVTVYWGRELEAVGFTHPSVMKHAERLARRHLEQQVADPTLRATLTPSYVLGCKRVLLSNDYLPSLSQPNVDVITDPISSIAPDGVVTASGNTYPADTIIFGTGFHATDPPIARRIFGPGGRPVSDAWTPSMRAYLGTTVAGFPNLFFLLGPNTGLGHTSVVLMIESQLHHVLSVLRHQRRLGLTAVEPSEAAQLRWNELVDRQLAGTVWAQGGCVSWYLDPTGRNSTLWPGYATGFRRRLRRLRPSDYVAATAAVSEWAHET